MIGRLFRWLRRLLPTPSRAREAAQPTTSKRILHLLDPGMRSACGLQASAQNWITVQLQYVNCKTCRTLGERRRVRQVTRVR